MFTQSRCEINQILQTADDNEVIFIGNICGIMKIYANTSSVTDY